MICHAAAAIDGCCFFARAMLFFSLMFCFAAPFIDAIFSLTPAACFAYFACQHIMFRQHADDDVYYFTPLTLLIGLSAGFAAMRCS